MCLKVSNRSKLMTIKKPKIVYVVKEVDRHNKIHSLFNKEFIWKIGTIHASDISVPYYYFTIMAKAVYHGFHSCKRLKDAKILRRDSLYYNHINPTIFKALIPKGNYRVGTQCNVIGDSALKNSFDGSFDGSSGYVSEYLQLIKEVK